MPTPPLVPGPTPRLRFRPFTTADAPLLHRLVGDPEVMRHLQGDALAADRVEVDVLVPLLADAAAQPGYGRLAVERAGTGEFVGWVSLVPRVPDPGPVYGWKRGEVGDPLLELGFRLVRSAWGQGLATEAAAAAAAHAATRLAARRLVATTMVVNHGSCRVLERVGFRRTAVHVLDWPRPNPGAQEGEAQYALDLAPPRGALGAQPR